MCQIIVVLYRCPVGLTRDPRCPWLQSAWDGSPFIKPYSWYYREMDDRWVCCGSHTLGLPCWECPSKHQRFIMADDRECPACEERIKKEREEEKRKMEEEGSLAASIAWVDQMIDDIEYAQQGAEEEPEQGEEKEAEAIQEFPLTVTLAIREKPNPNKQGSGPVAKDDGDDIIE